MSTKQHRYWVFTENDDERIRTFWLTRLRDRSERFPETVRYLVGQLERGDRSGREHIQGYVELRRGQRLSWLKKNLSNRAHWEPRKGTREEARAYCTKEDTRVEGPWEYGESSESEQGKRNDLEEIQKRCRAGATVKEIAEEFPAQFIRYHRGIRELQSMFQKRRDPDVNHEVHVYFGPGGCGKTSRVYLKYGIDNVFTTMSDSKWFDRYNGENVVLFDDWNVGWFSVQHMRRLLDRYPINVESKGGTYSLSNDITIFTTNTLPGKWWDWSRNGGEDGFDAFIRRITTWHVWYDVGKSVECPDYETFLEVINTEEVREFWASNSKRIRCRQK